MTLFKAFAQFATVFISALIRGTMSYSYPLPVLLRGWVGPESGLTVIRTWQAKY